MIHVPGGGSAAGLRLLLADLHVHTVVSPCAEVEMIPPLIIRRARELGLGVIAVTDHNTADNVAAVQRAAMGSGITVLPGMEVQSREEVHVLCLFGSLAALLAWQDVVLAHLPHGRNDADILGAQFVVDETGEFVRMNERLLLTSTQMAIHEIVQGVRNLGGLAIAAHVDRPTFSLLVNLGFVPPKIDLAALEISNRMTPAAFHASHPELAHWPLILSGDAHRLSEMRANTLLRVKHPSLDELRLALGGIEGRIVKVLT